MKQNIIWYAIVSSIVLLSGVTGITIYQDVFAGTEKVEVCHKGKTISIAAEALPAHIAHGDAEGACNGGGCSGVELVCDCKVQDVTACLPPNFTCSEVDKTAYCSNIGCVNEGGRAGPAISCG